MTGDLDKHIGTIFFFPRGSTFVRVDAVSDINGEDEPGTRWMLECTNLAEPIASKIFDPGEIGEELFPIPSNYSTDRIEQYIRASKDIDIATVIKMDIEYEILMPDGEQSE
ncbi:MAG: hypothetical protein AAFV59_07525 [Pseudomonadota bacterium]